MVSEDPETYDIHADIVGGWPNVVTPVLEVLRETRMCHFSHHNTDDQIICYLVSSL
jgi:hypothetical protein